MAREVNKTGIVTILDDFRKEIDEIRALVGKACSIGDHDEIMAAVESHLQQVLMLANEQNLLLNARLKMENSSPLSYADALKKVHLIEPTNFGIRQPPVKTTDTLLLYPSDPSTESEKTFRNIKQQVDINSLKITVNKVKFIKNGGIAVNLDDKSSAKALRRAVNDLPDFSVKKPTVIYPYAKVIGVPDDIEDEQVLTAISELTIESVSPDTTLPPVKKIYATKHSRSKTRSLVLQLHPKQWRTAVLTGHLNVSWYRLKVVNCVPTKRCFRCQAFGHTAKTCDAVKSTCSYCSKDHDIKSCTSISDTGNCANCVKHNFEYRSTYPTNHPATSYQCAVYKSYRSKQEQAIKYIRI